jgi:hypothetical protein
MPARGFCDRQAFVMELNRENRALHKTIERIVVVLDADSAAACVVEVPFDLAHLRGERTRTTITPCSTQPCVR